MENSQNVKVTKRACGDRGITDMGWLYSQHSFSFGQYVDPGHVGFRSLRVINEDRVQPGQGFGTHPHKSMEILTYVVDGQLEHKDSLGNGRIINAGEFQYMSAGSGVRHSEFNPSSDSSAHFLQIWILPREKGGEPRYKDFDTSCKRVKDGLYLLASPNGSDDAAHIRQDAEVHFGDISADAVISLPGKEDYPYAWIQVIKGAIKVAGISLEAGDGAAIEGAGFDISGNKDAEFLLFRMQ